MRDWDVVAMFMGVFLLIVFLIGALVWSSQDFANRCERADGVNIAYKVCIPKGTQVLMTSSVAGDES